VDRDILYDVAGNCCELCGSNQNLSRHHIYPKSDPRHCSDAMWNTIIVCMTEGKSMQCHRHYSADNKTRLLIIHMRHIDEYCTKWGMEPNDNWTGLVSAQR